MSPTATQTWVISAIAARYWASRVTSSKSREASRSNSVLASSTLPTWEKLGGERRAPGRDRRVALGHRAEAGQQLLAAPLEPPQLRELDAPELVGDRLARAEAAGDRLGAEALGGLEVAVDRRPQRAEQGHVPEVLGHAQLGRHPLEGLDLAVGGGDVPELEVLAQAEGVLAGDELVVGRGLGEQLHLVEQRQAVLGGPFGILLGEQRPVERDHQGVGFTDAAGHLERLAGELVAALDVSPQLLGREHAEQGGARGAVALADGLEGGLDRGDDLLVGVANLGDAPELDRGPNQGVGIAELLGQRGGLVEGLAGARELPARGQGLGEGQQQLQALARLGAAELEQLESLPEQLGGVLVGELLHRLAGREARVVDRPPRVAGGARREVVVGELAEARLLALGGEFLDRLGDLRVELGALRARELVVEGFADQGVGEGVAVGGAGRGHQPRADRLLGGGAQARLVEVADLHHQPPVELAADRSRDPQCRVGVLGELVEAPPDDLAHTLGDRELGRRGGGALGERSL